MVGYRLLKAPVDSRLGVFRDGGVDRATWIAGENVAYPVLSLALLAAVVHLRAA